jgi:hypothetical protein
LRRGVVVKQNPRREAIGVSGVEKKRELKG